MAVAREPQLDAGALLAESRGADGAVDPSELGRRLLTAWGDAYRATAPDCALVQMDDGSATYLFDYASSVDAPQADRSVTAWGQTRPAAAPRDAPHHRGYPSPAGRAGGRWTGVT